MTHEEAYRCAGSQTAVIDLTPEEKQSRALHAEIQQLRNELAAERLKIAVFKTKAIAYLREQC